MADTILHKKCEYCDECPNEEQVCDMDKFKSHIIKEIGKAIERMLHLKNLMENNKMIMLNQQSIEYW